MPMLISATSIFMAGQITSSKHPKSEHSCLEGGGGGGTPVYLRQYVRCGETNDTLHSHPTLGKPEGFS